MSLPVSAIFLFSLLPVVVSRCPDSWVIFGRSCYAYIDIPSNWADAQTICTRLNSHVVEIESAAENRFLVRKMKKVHASKTWLGINDFVREHKYVSTITNKEITYSNWAPGQPDNYRKIEDCAAILLNGNWHDAPCDVHRYTFFCERSVCRANGRNGRSTTAD